MLNKGLRDEQAVRIDNILKTLLSLVFVPKFWNVTELSAIDERLEKFGMTLETISNSTSEDLIKLLNQNNLDFEQLEKFADILGHLSKGDQYNFGEKAVSIYKFIQTESHTMSFSIMGKIAGIQNK